MKDRLFELIEQSFERCKSTPHCSKCTYTGTGGNCFKYLMVDHILGNGVIVLPCKIGDTVYEIDLLDYEPCKKNGHGGDVCPYLYAEYGVGYECLKTRCGEKPLDCAEIKAVKIDDIKQIFNYYFSFGKTVFLTREEAENAIKKRSTDERN